MALGGGAGSWRLRGATMLEQLLDEINFQRTKEMRQLLKDECGFVVLQGTTHWTDLFVRHFLFQEERAIDCDDLLFFVRKRHVKGSSRYLPKYETDVEVFRKDSKKLPIGDPEIDWEETVYLNLVVHQFDYTLTLAVCTRTSPKELQVLKRHSHKVYASPSRRKMDTKGEGEEMTYPHICFMVDNFDEVFCDIVVRDGEMVCVELAARGRGGGGGGGSSAGGGGGGAQAVIFLGSIRYDALGRVYDSRQSSLSTKVAQRMSFGLLGGGGGASSSRCEFVRMKGPGGKGHAEMCVSRPRGCGLDTPASEPPHPDDWDSDWEDDPDDMLVFRHQRRLSDPSANINTFARGGWRARDRERERERGEAGGAAGGAGGAGCAAGERSRSEAEALDSLVTGTAEVEAGDVRDERRGSRASSVRGPRPVRRAAPAPAAPASRARPRPAAAACMAAVCAHSPAADVSSPACLHTVTPKRRSARAAPGPPPLRPLAERGRTQQARRHRTAPATAPAPLDDECECEVAADAGSLADGELACGAPAAGTVPAAGGVTVRGAEELPTTREYRDANGNEGCAGAGSGGGARAYCTLPRALRGVAARLYRRAPLPPRRTTPDGTDIFYWCDVATHTHELDDGLYNPLWALRGFSQTYHLWKEGRRAQSQPLNAHLTYVTLPWWSIAKDILDHREEPILTF